MFSVLPLFNSSGLFSLIELLQDSGLDRVSYPRNPLFILSSTGNEKKQDEFNKSRKTRNLRSLH